MSLLARLFKPEMMCLSKLPYVLFKICDAYTMRISAENDRSGPHAGGCMDALQSICQHSREKGSSSAAFAEHLASGFLPIWPGLQFIHLTYCLSLDNININIDVEFCRYVWTKEGKRAGAAFVEDDAADEHKDGQAAKKDSPGLVVSPSSSSSDSD